MTLLELKQDSVYLGDTDCPVHRIIIPRYVLSPHTEERLGLSTLTSSESLSITAVKQNGYNSKCPVSYKKSPAERTFFWNEDQSCNGSVRASWCTEYSWIPDICQLLDSVAGEEGGRWHLSPNNEGWASNREVSKHPKSKCMDVFSWLRGCFVLSGAENKKLPVRLLCSSAYVFYESWQFCIIPIPLCDSIIIYMTSFF